MLKSTKTKNFKDDKEDYPLEKFRECKNMKEYIDKRYKINQLPYKNSMKRKLSLSFNNEPKKYNKYNEKSHQNKHFIEDNYEDLTIEIETSNSIKRKHQKKRRSILKSRIPKDKNIEMVYLSEDERPSRLSQLSLKQSKYISSQKPVSSIKLSKGNIKDHEPKSIICGYQMENGEKIYLIDWHNTDDTITLPTFIPSSILKENYISLIVEYLENIIVNH